MLMCRKHWFKVPQQLRDQVWATYRPGQEVDQQPSAAYLVAQRAAVEAVAQAAGDRVAGALRHPAGLQASRVPLQRRCGGARAFGQALQATICPEGSALAAVAEAGWEDEDEPARGPLTLPRLPKLWKPDGFK
jgi:hypothetical protein